MRAFIQIHRSLLFALLLAGLTSAATLSAQVSYNESTDGDLPVNFPASGVPVFTMVAGTNTWNGSCGPTGGANPQDAFIIDLPGNVKLDKIEVVEANGRSTLDFSVVGGGSAAVNYFTAGTGTYTAPSGGIAGNDDPDPLKRIRFNVIINPNATLPGAVGWTVRAFISSTGTGSSNVAPSITTNPTSSTVCAGSTASFTAAASGTPAPTVQWQVNSGGGFGNIGGATGTTYSFTTSAGQSGNEYRAVFANSEGSATSTAATLTVNQAPSITTHPTTQTVCEGYNLTLNAGASSTPAASVQWQVNSGGGFGNIGGATSTTYSVPVTQGINGNEYRAVFTNTCGSTNTNAATITVKPPVTLDVTLAPQLITSSGQFMQTINAIVSVQNGCSPTWVLESITSSDADAGTFPEDIADDIQGETLETADVQFQVRAEVTPLQDDRTYEVTYRVDDGTYSNTFTEAIIVPSGIGTLAPGGTNNCGANFGTIPVMTGGTVTIPFTLATASTVRLTIYNTKGKAVAGLINEVPTSAGSHTATWDGTNNAGLNPGTPQPNGYYFVLIEACNDFRGVAVLVVDRP